MPNYDKNIFVHDTAVISDNVSIGSKTKIWHHVHVREGAKIGKECVLGKDVYIDHYVKIGNHVKIQNGVSIYNGVTLEDEVFVGPNAVFTNDLLPRAVHTSWRVVETHVERGSSIGANATVVCGVRLGAHCMVGAGSVVTKHVRPHALVVGNPGKTIGYVCACGSRLHQEDPVTGSHVYQYVCSACKNIYELPHVGESKDDVIRTSVDGIQFIHHEFGTTTLNVIDNVLRSGWVAGCGSETTRFEKKIAEVSQCAFAVVTNSGTSALFAALNALEIGKGDEVIVADFSYPASGMSVLHTGAVPRFADVRLDTYNLDVAILERLVNKKTKAVLVVHTFGQMAPIQKIIEWARSHGFHVIEDAACAIGSTYDSAAAGSLSDIACYSFHARKIITTGEGGAVVTNRADLHEKVRAFTSLGIDRSNSNEGNIQSFEFDKLGYNFKLSDINCSIGLQQIRHLSTLIERRQDVAEKYRKSLAGVEEIILPYAALKANHVYQAFVCQVTNRIKRDDLIAKLKIRNIHSTIGTYAQHLQPLFDSKDSCPHSKQLYTSTIALPFHSFLEQSQIDHVSEQLKLIVSELR